MQPSEREILPAWSSSRDSSALIRTKYPRISLRTLILEFSPYYDVLHCETADSLSGQEEMPHLTTCFKGVLDETLRYHQTHQRLYRLGPVFEQAHRIHPIEGL